MDLSWSLSSFDCWSHLYFFFLMRLSQLELAKPICISGFKNTEPQYASFCTLDFSYSPSLPYMLGENDLSSFDLFCTTQTKLVKSKSIIMKCLSICQLPRKLYCVIQHFTILTSWRNVSSRGINQKKWIVICGEKKEKKGKNTVLYQLDLIYF